MVHFDAIIIGTGQSGPYLAKRFAKEGYKVAIIEEGNFGGSCVNSGCTPTKALIANAKIAHSVRIAKTFGVNVKGFEIDYKAIKRRKDQFVRAGSDWVKDSLKKTKGITVYEGSASFEGSHQIRVGSKILEGEKIFINVGATPLIPEQVENVLYLTNVSLLELKTLPKHLLILGGGYVALEFAQMYRRFGSEVTVIQRGPRLMKKEDPEISEAIQKILEKEKIKIYTDVSDISFKKERSHIVAEFKKKKIITSHVLVAVGRIPNTKHLRCENAGIKVDEKGVILVNDFLQTSLPHIWALGDCNGKGAFTHTSYNDYEIVSANLFDQGKRRVSDRNPIYALYTDPPLGRVGLNEEQAQQKYKKVLSAVLPISSVARAREEGQTEGFLKILIDAETNKILGASFLGIHCDEVIQLIALVMSAKLPYTILQKSVGIHPTVSELIPTLLEKL